MNMTEQLLRDGVLLLEQGYLTQACACFNQILSVSPGHAGALSNLANALQESGEQTKANELRQQLLTTCAPPLRWRVASNYLVGLQYQFAPNAAHLRQAAERIGFAMGQGSAADCSDHKSGPARVGFISADFCDHPAGLFFLPVLQSLDRNRIEPVLFFTRTRLDSTAGELQSLAEWHDVSGMDDDTLTAWLNRHRLDAMVDLSGHTSGNRLPVLARRVAPVQISWLGYFSTTGVPAMDYVLMDPWHVPFGAEEEFTETVVRMPCNRFCYSPATFAPSVASPPSASRGVINFGSFNNTAKYNANVFSTWAAILRRVERSRLILKWRTFRDESYRQRVLQLFQEFGVNKDRIELRSPSSHAQLLSQYAEVDVALDPFPFSGGHTSCEALWMGVPIITLPGERAVSRQTKSFIACLGQQSWLERWVAENSQDYVNKAIELALDESERASIRGRLREIMRNSPLLDARQFARDFETTLESLMQRVRSDNAAD